MAIALSSKTARPTGCAIGNATFFTPFPCLARGTGHYPAYRLFASSVISVSSTESGSVSFYRLPSAGRGRGATPHLASRSRKACVRATGSLPCCPDLPRIPASHHAWFRILTNRPCPRAGRCSLAPGQLSGFNLNRKPVKDPVQNPDLTTGARLQRQGPDPHVLYPPPTHLCLPGSSYG